MSLKLIFKDARIVGLCGNKNSGKTNNLIRLITDFRKLNKEVKIYAYGMDKGLSKTLRDLNIEEICSIEQLVYKKNCIIIIDEFQKLRFNTPKHREELNAFVDFIYHSNCYCILSSPNIREFNSIIGGVVEKWLLKSVRIDQCINGSQLKKVIDSYKGHHKVLGSIDLPKNRLLVINNDKEIVLKLNYVKSADTKKGMTKIF